MRKGSGEGAGCSPAYETSLERWTIGKACGSDQRHTSDSFGCELVAPLKWELPQSSILLTDSTRCRKPVGATDDLPSPTSLWTFAGAENVGMGSNVHDA